MAIHRIVAAPADIGVGGYTWTTSANRFDPTRVSGAFLIAIDQFLTIAHPASTGEDTWYHFTLNDEKSLHSAANGDVAVIRDAASLTLASVNYVAGALRVGVLGTAWGGVINTSNFSSYQFDVRVNVTETTVSAWMYVNGVLASTASAPLPAGRGKPAQFVMSGAWPINRIFSAAFSEVLIADEDTRGLRVRELRPTALGVHREWSGSASALRDADLATGIAVNEADRRSSFGVSGLGNMRPGDVINRIVMQTYAARGEEGPGGMNQFLRLLDGTIYDGADTAVGEFGEFYIQEFLTNPGTGERWLPEQLGGLQIGVRSRET